MKLEYLNDITGNGRYPDTDPDKLIRLYDFEHDEARQLQAAILQQIISRNLSLTLSSIPFIQSVNCSLVLVPAEQDLGITIPSDNTNFIGMFTIASFHTMIEMIQPFTEEKSRLGGYNWLYDPAAGQVDLLFSSGGSW